MYLDAIFDQGFQFSHAYIAVEIPDFYYIGVLVFCVPGMAKIDLYLGKNLIVFYVVEYFVIHAAVLTAILNFGNSFFDAFKSSHDFFLLGDFLTVRSQDLFGRSCFPFP
jgi:hypothetical protein